MYMYMYVCVLLCIMNALLWKFSLSAHIHCGAYATAQCTVSLCVVHSACVNSTCTCIYNVCINLWSWLCTCYIHVCTHIRNMSRIYLYVYMYVCVHVLRCNQWWLRLRWQRKSTTSWPLEATPSDSTPGNTRYSCRHGLLVWITCIIHVATWYITYICVFTM